jgi:hypothetical protein
MANWDARADLNCDEEVDDTDADILLKNLFGRGE